MIFVIKRSKLHFFSPSQSQYAHSYSSLSNTISNLSTFLQGRVSRPNLLQIHARVFRLHAHQDHLIATRLIGQYPFHISIKVFSLLKRPNIFPFNAIIRVSSQQGLFLKAFNMFKALKEQSLLPNELTFSFILKGCFRCGNVLHVKMIHTQIVKLGFCEDSVVGNGLLGVYAKGFYDLISARRLFDEIHEKGMVCGWNSLIAGCARSRRSDDALELFVGMLKENVMPNDDTLINVLSACSIMETTRIEKWVDILLPFTSGDNYSRLDRDLINIVLIHLYGKWGKIEKSRQRFDDVVDNGSRSPLSWNVMISTYFRNDFPLEAVDLFHRMIEKDDCQPNHVTMVSVLAACAQVGNLDLGRWVHNYMKSKGCKGILESNAVLATALIDMYSKCGCLEMAKQVFDQMASKDVVSFNAMIMGLAVNSEGEEAIRLFYSMKQAGLCPNSGTFLAALCACSHSGLLDHGRQIFSDMKLGVSVSPSLEHYACYIDLLSRVGCIEEALEVVRSMPFEPNNFVWGSLLGGCLLHRRGDAAQFVSRKLVEVDPHNSAGYVMLANALAADQQWHDVLDLRLSMKEAGVRKPPGNSWISIDGVVHEFIVGSAKHSQIGTIYQVLTRLVKEMKVAHQSYELYC